MQLAAGRGPALSCPLSPCAFFVISKLIGQIGKSNPHHHANISLQDLVSLFQF